MRSTVVLFTLFVVAAASSLAHAAELDFTFLGTTNNPLYNGRGTQFIDSGTVAITYSGTASTLTLADITAFTLTRGVAAYSINPSLPNYVMNAGSSSTYTQDLTQLTTLAIALLPGTEVVSSISFTTAAVLPPTSIGFYTAPNSFSVTTLAPAIFTYSTTGTGTTGAFTPAVPEPATLGLTGAGALLILARRRAV